ncbi:MAG: hypothetical protein GX923_08730 [Clostridia bacterium]|nr:hypothetical protein [Clostridia bacterium]
MQHKKTFFFLSLVLVVVFSTYFFIEGKLYQSLGALVQKEVEKEEDQKEIEKVDETSKKNDDKIDITEEQEVKEESLPLENPEVIKEADLLRDAHMVANNQQLASRSQSASNQQAHERSQQEVQKEVVKSEPVNKQIKTDFNAYVLDIIKTYDIKNISYPYLLNNDYSNYNGVTTNLVFQGQTLAKAHPSGNRASHCVGITFEVFFKAMQARNKALGKSVEDFNGLNFNQLQDLMLTWYVANGSKSISNVTVALERYGLGKRIYNWESVRAGDFIDFNRSNGTGHTAVFLEWIRDNNNSIIGIKYWSSQESTNGINYKDEYFGSVLKDPFYIARVY